MIPEEHVDKDKPIVPEKRVFRALLLLVVISTMLAVVVALFEGAGSFRTEQPKRLSGAEIPRKVIEPPVAPITLLPESILQYATRGRQAIPGSELPSAEAIYEVLDANISLATPVNSYAKATYFPSEHEAEDSVSEALKDRFPKDNENLMIGSTIVKTGYDNSEGSYFIGWTRDNFSITIKTSFLDHIPTDKRDTLQKHVMPIAKEIIQGSGAKE